MSDFFIGVVTTICVWWLAMLLSMVLNKKMGHVGAEERAFAATLVAFGGPIIAIGFVVDFLRHRSIGNQVKEIEKKK